MDFEERMWPFPAISSNLSCNMFDTILHPSSLMLKHEAFVYLCIDNPHVFLFATTYCFYDKLSYFQSQSDFVALQFAEVRVRQQNAHYCFIVCDCNCRLMLSFYWFCTLMWHFSLQVLWHVGICICGGEENWHQMYSDIRYDMACFLTALSSRVYFWPSLKGGVSKARGHRWPQITGGHSPLPASLFKHISFHKVIKVITLHGSFKEACILLHKCLSGFKSSVQKLIFCFKKATGSKSGRRMNWLIGKRQCFGD